MNYGKLSVNPKDFYIYNFLFCILYYPVLRHSLGWEFSIILMISQQIAVLLFLFVLVKKRILKYKSGFLFLSVYIFFIFYNLIITLYFISDRGYNFDSFLINSVVIQNIRFIINFLSWMICAYVIINFIGRGEVLFKWYHHLIIVCSVLFNINYDVFLILVDEFDIRVLNYQTWGDSFAIIGLIAISQAKKSKFYILSILYLLVLFFIPSRSSLVVFIISLLFLYFIFLKGIFLRLILFGVVFSSIIFIGYYEMPTGSRHSSLINISASDSNSVRIDTIIAGWKYFSENPILGRYAFQLEEFNDPGLYMHNWLDMLVQLGGLGTIIFICFLITFKRFFQIELNYDQRRICYVVFVFSILSFIVSRNYQVSYLYFGVAMGLLAFPIGKKINDIQN